MGEKHDKYKYNKEHFEREKETQSVNRQNLKLIVSRLFDIKLRHIVLLLKSDILFLYTHL